MLTLRVLKYCKTGKLYIDLKFYFIITKKMHARGPLMIEHRLIERMLSVITLIELYPIDIEKEDKKFFLSSRIYFTDEEDQKILAEFLGFDRKMIHEKNKSVVKELENQR
jgi:hypothetical protein